MMQILLMDLLVLMALTHIVAVIADQYSAADTGKSGQGGNEIGVILFETDFQIQFHFAGLGGLAFDHTACHMGLDELFCLVLTLLAVAFSTRI